MQPTRTDSLQAISDVLERQQDVQLGIVFGSLAREGGGRDSDADVAVVATGPLDPERRAALTRALAEATGRPVDLVDLRRAGVVLLRSVLREGRTVLERDASLRPELLSRMLTDSEDFLPLLERLWRERRARWTG